MNIDGDSYARAMLNILADLSEEKERLQDSEKAVLNVLEDVNAERARLYDNQSALLNILEDAALERSQLRAVQLATMNIIEDADSERLWLQQTHRASLNILDDFDDERNERRQAEEEVRRLNAELEQRVADRTERLESANKELEAFSYSVSHDLRTPLRAIDGFSKMLLKKYDERLDDEGRRLLHVVRDNTARMAQLIDDMLAFSRAGRLELRASMVDMEVLIRDVWQELGAALAGRDVRLDVQPLPPAHGDPTMLRQVWANLLANAVKFTRPRPVAVIEVGGDVEGGECVYRVADNGVGFNSDYLAKLFGVFQRLHGIEEFEGTGIGLAIVKRIVARHGGRVFAEGQVDGGATFHFSLPRG